MKLKGKNDIFILIVLFISSRVYPALRSGRRRYILGKTLSELNTAAANDAAAEDGRRGKENECSRFHNSDSVYYRFVDLIQLLGYDRSGKI